MTRSAEDRDAAAILAGEGAAPVPSLSEMRRPRWARALPVGTHVEVQLPYGRESIWRPGVVRCALPRGVRVAVDETTVDVMAGYLVRRAP